MRTNRCSTGEQPTWPEALDGRGCRVALHLWPCGTHQVREVGGQHTAARTRHLHVHRVSEVEGQVREATAHEHHLRATCN